MWKIGILLMLLLLLSIWDIRECRVPVPVLAIGSALVGIIVGYELLTGRINWLQPAMGSLAGLFLLAMAWLTKKAGYADGIVLLWLGILQDYKRGLMILSISLLLVSLVSIVLLILRRVRRYTRIPFIPFLTMGYVIAVFCC